MLDKLRVFLCEGIVIHHVELELKDAPVLTKQSGG